jgi:hypothetical protein
MKERLSNKMLKENQLAIPLDQEGNLDGNRVINFDISDRERRNSRLAKFFNNLGLPARLIGDANSPAIIIDDAMVLSGYVKNFELRFTDVPSHGQVIYTIKLLHQQIVDRDEVFRVILSSEHRPVYRINLVGTKFFLAGYNFVDKQNSQGRYPVFSTINPKIYFSEASAKESIDAINNDLGGPYSLQVIRKEINLTDYYTKCQEEFAE